MNKQNSTRSRTIIQYNTAGIVLNLLLSAAKLVVGLAIKSRAVMLDAINGFSDILSSFITMISTIYAGRHRDRDHPFGYGRMEYIASMLTTVFILCMGLHAIYGAIRELLSSDGSAPDYNTAVIVLMIVSLAAKSFYGLAAHRTGKRIGSVALIMIGIESLGDSLVSLAILVTIVIYRATGLDLEPWLSILISLYLVKTGLSMLRECINKLVGTRGDPEVYKTIKRLIADEPGVLNVFNLVIHNYGEEQIIGSVDISVEEEMKAADTTRLTRRIVRKAAENGVTLSSVGVYGSGSDPESTEIWDRILGVIRTHPEFLRAYAFSYDPPPENNVFFLVVADPSVHDKKNLITALEADLKQVFPDISFDIGIALDV